MIRVSVRFNMFGARVIKQGIVPCKLLIAASEIIVLLVAISLTRHQFFAKRTFHFRTSHSH